MCHIRKYRTTLVGRESGGKVERSGWERVAPTMMAKGRQQKARARQAAGVGGSGLLKQPALAMVAMGDCGDALL